MKTRDNNDVLRDQGPDALRDAFDKAPRSKPAPNPRHTPSPTEPIYSSVSLRTERFAMLKHVAGDIIVEGLTLLAARPKIGKTWLALDIAIAVARGGYCLGDIQCEQGAVLFLALEDNRRRMQRRLTRLLGAATEWPAFSIAHDWPRADAGGLDRITDWITTTTANANASGRPADMPRMIVVDVLARFRKLTTNGKQQTYEADYQAIADLQKIAGNAGIAIIVIHHTRKGESDDPIDAVSGTLGLAGAADAVLVIGRQNDGSVQLYGRSRDVDEIDKALRFDRETCRWTILGATTEVQRSNARKRIFAALEEQEGPMTPKAISAQTGQPVGTVQVLLGKMLKLGEVAKLDYGSYVLPAYNTPIESVVSVKSKGMNS